MAPAIWRSYSACRGNNRKHGRGLSIKHPTDRTHRLPALPTVPNHSSLRSVVINTTKIVHGKHSIFAQRLKCCDHLLSPSDKAALEFVGTKSAPGSNLPLALQFYGEVQLPKSAIRAVRSTQAYRSFAVKDQLIFETATTPNNQND